MAKDDYSAWDTKIEQPFDDFKQNNKGIWRAIKYGSLGVAGLVVGFSGVYTVDTHEEAVIQRFGKYERTTTEGLHWKVPFFESVTKVPVKEVRKEEFGFRTTKVGEKSEFKPVAEESRMVCGDENLIDLDFTVQYKIGNSKEYLFNVNDPEQALRDVSEAVMRQIVGDYGIDESMTEGKGEIQDQARVSIQIILDSYGTGLHIENVQLQDVSPPEKVKPAFNLVTQARQEKTKLINEAWSKYNAQVPEAEGRALQVAKQAEAYKITMVNTARGDADRFIGVLAEYNKNPKITEERMAIETLEKILKGSGKVTVIDGDMPALLPHLSVPGGQ